MHISVILALMALTKTVQYYLAPLRAHALAPRRRRRRDLHRREGAAARRCNLLMFISVAAAILFIVNIFRRGWVFPIIAVGLWGFISIVVGTIYPGRHPALRRCSRTSTHGSRRTSSATSTRPATAFGLDKITTKPFQYDTDLTPTDVDAAGEPADARQRAALGSGARCGQVLTATEEFQPFYSFSDVDVDRYNDRRPDARRRSAACASSTRRSCPSNTWTNRHLVYTHGYGIDTAQANAHNGDQPSYLLSDIPPHGELAARPQPDVYFGEGLQQLRRRRQQGRRAGGQRREQRQDHDSTRATAA